MCPNDHVLTGDDQGPELVEGPADAVGQTLAGPFDKLRALLIAQRRVGDYPEGIYSFHLARLRLRLSQRNTHDGY